MHPPSVLIAHPDYGTIHQLSSALFDHIPNITICTCATANEIPQKAESYLYNAVVLKPLFLPAYQCVPKKQDQLLRRLLVTVGQKDLTVAQAALEGDVFDLIATPIDPVDAVQTVRMALWHNQLLKLLASRERATARFRQHMEAFPHDRKAEQHYVRDGEAFARTFQALQSSLRQGVNMEDEQAIFDMAALVEQRARQRALERLLHLCQDVTS
jgi:DNA-binding NtrC family response regulator